MKLACVAVLALAGCKGILGIESGVVGDRDARIDDAADDGDVDGPPPDARTCFGTFQQICLTDEPPETYQATNATVVDTLLACTDARTIDGVDVCIRSAKHIVVAAGASITTVGNRFLVLVASEDITIAGTLDTWGAGSTTCTTAQAGMASGGAGGSFGALGGAGNGASRTTPKPVPATITTFRKGCRGDDGGSDTQGGGGGEGGPGIFLVAPSIHLTSTARINASGYGGGGGNNDRGGGGGGSGGFIVLDSDTLQVDASAVVIALGAGGGGGGGGGTAQTGMRATTNLPIVAPAGGLGNAGASGDGGDGGVQAEGGMGGLGTNGRGSGGGGGGTGVIFVTAQNPTINGVVVPTPRAP